MCFPDAAPPEQGADSMGLGKMLTGELTVINAWAPLGFTRANSSQWSSKGVAWLPLIEPLGLRDDARKQSPSETQCKAAGGGG